VPAAVTAVLFQFQAIGVILFIFAGSIITALAFSTCQGNTHPHCRPPPFMIKVGRWKIATMAIPAFPLLLISLLTKQNLSLPP
jgi:hypothetical protein